MIEDVTQEELPVFHELDVLAGTWTQEEAEEFLQATTDFRRVEEALWCLTYSSFSFTE